MLRVRAFSRTVVWYLHNSGIRCLRALRALNVRTGYRCKNSWLLVWMSYNSRLYLSMEAKYLGTLLFTNLYQIFMHCTLKMSLIFNNFKLLNSGSVCALYLLFVMTLITRFYSLDNLSDSNPQEVITNCKWDTIKEQYISFIAERGK